MVLDAWLSEIQLDMKNQLNLPRQNYQIGSDNVWQEGLRFGF